MHVLRRRERLNDRQIPVALLHAHLEQALVSVLQQAAAELLLLEDGHVLVVHQFSAVEKGLPILNVLQELGALLDLRLERCIAFLAEFLDLPLLALVERTAKVEELALGRQLLLIRSLMHDVVVNIVEDGAVPTPWKAAFLRLGLDFTKISRLPYCWGLNRLDLRCVREQQATLVLLLNSADLSLDCLVVVLDALGRLDHPLHDSALVLTAAACHFICFN